LQKLLPTSTEKEIVMEAGIRRNSQPDALAAGIAPVVERVAAGAHEAVDKAANAANAAARSLDKKSDELGRMQARYLDGCREQVRDNPLAAVGIALAAGFIVSYLLSRR
jgi:ElaB/YqjD/DUF883 family membrane-anchored ribosome-binding protein